MLLSAIHQRYFRMPKKEHLNHMKSHSSTSLSVLLHCRSLLVHVKDKTENLKKCATVYHIHCEHCDKEYVSETSRLLETRVKEHLSRNLSAVH